MIAAAIGSSLFLSSCNTFLGMGRDFQRLGQGFENSVNKAIAITNKFAKTASTETLYKMELAFEKASKLEWMFWDSAYNKEQWKI